MRIAVGGALAGVAAIEAEMASAAEAGAELLVLPELALDDGVGLASDAADLDALGRAAARLSIALLVGYREHCPTGSYSAVQLIEANGHSTANYRAAHPGAASRRAGHSDQASRPAGHSGQASRPAEDAVDAGQWLTCAHLGTTMIGLLLADDILVPEAARALALKGAGLLILQRREPFDEIDLGMAIVRCRAYENGVPLVAVVADQAWAAARDGSIEQASHALGSVLLFDVEPSSGRSGCRQGRSPRRPELYKQLVAVDEGGSAQAG